MTGTQLGRVLSVLFVLAMALAGCCGKQVNTFARSAGAYQSGRPVVGAPQDSVIVFLPDQSTSVRMRITGKTEAPEQISTASMFPDFTVHHEVEIGANNRYSTVLYNSPPLVELYSGWMHFTGKAPIGKTRRVRAVGHGTTFIIEVGEHHDTIYMINEDNANQYVNVWAIQPNGTDEVACERLVGGQFIHITDERDAAGTLISRRCGRVQNIAENPTQCAFIQQALRQASDQP